MILEIMFAFSLLMNGISPQNLETSLDLGIKGQQGAKKAICLALKKIASSNEVCKGLKPKAVFIESIRNEYKNGVFEASHNLIAERKRIEDRYKNLLGSEYDSCGLVAINGGGECSRRLNENDRISINSDIRKFNKAFGEIMPKFDRWEAESESLKKIFFEAQKNADLAIDDLENECNAYWDATVLVNLAKGNEAVQDFTSFSIPFEREEDIKHFVRRRKWELSIRFFGMQRSVEDILDWNATFDPYWQNKLPSSIELLTGYIDAVASFSSEKCETQLDTIQFFDELLKFNLKKEDQ